MLKRWEMYWNTLYEEKLETIEATIMLRSDVESGTDIGFTVPVQAKLQKPSILPSSKRSAVSETEEAGLQHVAERVLEQTVRRRRCARLQREVRRFQRGREIRLDRRRDGGFGSRCLRSRRLVGPGQERVVVRRRGRAAVRFGLEQPGLKSVVRR